MAIVTTDNQHYTDIAAAIRSKNGTETQYKPSEMAAAIQAISGGGGEPEPPDDGKTRLYITIPANAMPDRPPPVTEVKLVVFSSIENGGTVDWGDGTPSEVLAKSFPSHTYKRPGNFIISIDPTPECILTLGNLSAYSGIMGSATGGSHMRTSLIISFLKKVYIGKNVLVSPGAFLYCVGLQLCAFSSFFNGESIGSGGFMGCFTLNNIIIPDSVLTIGDNSFSGCYGLNSIIVGRNVNEIQDYAFNDTRCVEFHFLSTTPPTLSSTNIFPDSTRFDYIIYVPVGSLEVYKTATNWTTYAQYIQEEPA